MEMAQLIVRDIEDSVKEELRRRAKDSGRSMEQEARDILRRAVLIDRPREDAAGTRMASLFKDLAIDFEIPELRGERVRPAKLRK